jgi:hypothetical protein
MWADVGRRAAAEAVRLIPEWTELLDVGRLRHLELGCGLSGAVLCLLRICPELTVDTVFRSQFFLAAGFEEPVCVPGRW